MDTDRVTYVTEEERVEWQSEQEEGKQKKQKTKEETRGPRQEGQREKPQWTPEAVHCPVCDMWLNGPTQWKDLTRDRA